MTNFNQDARDLFETEELYQEYKKLRKELLEQKKQELLREDNKRSELQEFIENLENKKEWY